MAVSAADLPADRDRAFEEAVLVPAGTYRVGSREEGCYAPETAKLSAFYIWPTEVPRTWLSVFRGEEAGTGSGEPGAFVSFEEAEAFCRWFSLRYHVTARLPTRREWECAARSGRGGVTYSWGWVAGEGPTRSRELISAAGTPNAWGLYDMCGSVAEWCAAEPGSDTAPVMGGSWAERDPRFLRVSHRLELPRDYRDADVGFRIVIEPNEETVASRSVNGK